MKNYIKIPELIFKKITEKISKDESQQLEDWINLNEENKLIYKEATKDENIKAALKKYFNYDVDSAWIKTEKRLNPKTIRLLSNKLLRYAAFLTIPLLIAGYLTLRFISDSNYLNKSLTDLPFEPGSEKAILTLSNGEEVVVGKHKLANSIKVSESLEVIDSNYTLVYETDKSSPKDLEYNTLQTPKGGEYSLVLADGSKVWLNADSKLKYPIAFSETERTVFIEGEAYFEIAEDKNKPFIVHTSAYSVNVLGTSFNVMAYNDEQKIATTLVEGSVKITKPDIENPIYLIPGQQAILPNKSNKIEIKSVDTHHFTAWKEGLFVFQSEQLGSIAKKLSRWYDCEIHFEDLKLQETKFTGSLRRNTELEELLNIISQTCNINFTLNENKVLIISN